MSTAVALVTEVTHTGFRATALATVTLANNMLGLAPGPVLVGALSDAYGLQAAMVTGDGQGLGRAIALAMPRRRERHHLQETEPRSKSHV